MRLKLPLVVLAAGLLLTACGPSAQILYYWGGEYKNVTEYERLAYRSSATESPASLCSMLVMYERLVNNPGGWRQVPPPGICAEYAWLLAQPETFTTFVQNASSRQKEYLNYAVSSASFQERSRELFEMEMRLYPESITFIKPLAERLFK